VDSTISVGYGARANEDGIWKSVGAVAAFAAVTLDGTDKAATRYQELTGRVRTAVGSESGLGPLENVVAEIAGVQSQVKAASDRHTTSKNLLLSAQDDVQGIDKTEVTAKLLDLQTRLEASYQVTSMLSKLSLVNYL
jgi:flagellin-like hook-associated protein FlgL